MMVLLILYNCIFNNCSSCYTYIIIVAIDGLINCIICLTTSGNSNLYHNAWAFPLMWRGVYITKTLH